MVGLSSQRRYLISERPRLVAGDFRWRSWRPVQILPILSVSEHAKTWRTSGCNGQDTGIARREKRDIRVVTYQHRRQLVAVMKDSVQKLGRPMSSGQGCTTCSVRWSVPTWRCCRDVFPATRGGYLER